MKVMKMMMMKMIGLLIILCLIGLNGAQRELKYDPTGSPLEVRSKRSKHSNFVRCTRRYTPGLCLEPVVPVWSFVFQLQNCTERLGCPVDWRGNRFGTYEACMYRCLPLIQLYLELLIHEHNNVSSLRIGSYWGSPIGLNVDEQSFLDEDEDYEVLLRKVTVEGPPPDPMDDDTDRKFQNIPDIDHYDNEDRKDDLDEDLLKN